MGEAENGCGAGRNEKYTDKQVGKGIIEVCPIVNKTFIFFYIL